MPHAPGAQHKFLHADLTFTSTRARDRALTQLLAEATARGLIAESWTVEYAAAPVSLLLNGHWKAGLWAVAGAPAPTLKGCFWHPSHDVVDLAVADLEAWLNANGKQDGACYTIIPD